jgi:hypothetical protein
MDLDSFLTKIYVYIDDWYADKMAPYLKRTRGSKPKMSDSEVLTVASAGSWRKGVPWQSERGSGLVSAVASMSGCAVCGQPSSHCSTNWLRC